METDGRGLQKQKLDKTFYIGLCIVIVIVVSLLILFRFRRIEELLPVQTGDITMISLKHIYSTPGTAGKDYTTQWRADTPESIASVLSVLQQYQYQFVSKSHVVQSTMGTLSDIYVYLHDVNDTITVLLISGKNNTLKNNQEGSHTEYRIVGGQERLYDQLYKLIHVS